MGVTKMHPISAFGQFIRQHGREFEVQRGPTTYLAIGCHLPSRRVISFLPEAGVRAEDMLQADNGEAFQIVKVNPLLFDGEVYQLNAFYGPHD